MNRSPLTAQQRTLLRRLLVQEHPWLEATEVGPQAVSAGDCTRCDTHPRLLPTCGPVAWAALCRQCAMEVGLDAWCDGHADDGRRALAWASGLPEDWEAVVRCWWVATGEIGLDPSLLDPARVALVGSVQKTSSDEVGP